LGERRGCSQADRLPRARRLPSFAGTKEVEVKGVRYFMRNFTATAVKEHLRSQVEDSNGRPELTPKEIELVHFVGSVDWDRVLAPTSSDPGGHLS
jgi:hypothetical protein